MQRQPEYNHKNPCITPRRAGREWPFVPERKNRWETLKRLVRRR